MTETDERPHEGRPHDSHEGPRVSGEQMRDLGRMRRSRTDRYLGGVAGGLARHLDIDPTVVRVLFVVTSFFGGAGLLAYLALWLLVPEEGSDHARVQLRGDTRRTVIFVVGAIAVLVLLGNAWGGNWGFWHFSWVLVAIGLVALLLASRDQRHHGQAGPPAGHDAAAPQQPSPYDEPTAPVATATDEPAGPQPPAPWQPPVPPPPAPRPRRTGIIWFWPTLALIAIGLGVLAVVGGSQDLAAGSYAALALAIIGAMLVLGAFVGRAGGLILLGLLTSIALLATTAVGQTGYDWHNRTLSRTPASTAAVQDDYHVKTGSIYLDLSQVGDPQGLDGRTVDVHLKAGQIHVLVPENVDVDIDAELKFAGDIDVAGQNHSGLHPVLRTTLDGGPDAPQLNLDLSGQVGQITVFREGATQ
ncbi:MAG TPA: PspC domain-containing protein [Marmoricola sp.]|nr:PspC domain-containing protein [Marmoricola sp.]